MKVIMINGSPHKEGCTYTALSEVGSALKSDGIDYEIINIGTNIASCLACRHCIKAGKCVIETDLVNEVAAKVAKADGLIIGSPVHYAAASGAITAFLDRLFFSSGRNFAFKPGAAIVSCRRAGSTAALDQLQKYFTISNMPLVATQYWPMVHGGKPEEALEDKEGMQTMRQLGHNMAWLVKSIALAADNGINHPDLEPRVWTNFYK